MALARLGRARIGVYPNLAEILPEARLHKGPGLAPCGNLFALAGENALQDIVHDSAS